jgi:hypothetical protein
MAVILKTDQGWEERQLVPIRANGTGCSQLLRTVILSARSGRLPDKTRIVRKADVIRVADQDSGSGSSHTL